MRKIAPAGETSKRSPFWRPSMRMLSTKNKHDDPGKCEAVEESAMSGTGCRFKPIRDRCHERSNPAPHQEFTPIKLTSWIARGLGTLLDQVQRDTNSGPNHCMNFKVRHILLSSHSHLVHPVSGSSFTWFNFACPQGKNKGKVWGHSLPNFKGDDMADFDDNIKYAIAVKIRFGTF